MVVAVNIPHLDGDAALLLAGVLTGVQQFFGEDAVVPFYFPIVFRGVRPDPLVSRGSERSCEICCPVA